MTFNKIENLKFNLTGDCHGNISRFPASEVLDSAYIILGDAGFNYYLNKKDEKLKERVNSLNCLFYLVRGNHEMRPENLSNIKTAYDENVKGEVYYEPAYPNIRYFQDGGEYSINNYSVLVIGGAYSVDKEYRLSVNYPWFPDEQLTKQEMNEILNKVKGKHYDLVFTHTCPLFCQPTDLFLNSIDQESVDNSMEIFLQKVFESINYNLWAFGHYHNDRIERPYIEQYYFDIELLDDFIDRWRDFDYTGCLPFWLEKSLFFKDFPFESSLYKKE